MRPDTATGLNSVQVIQPISQGAKALKDQLKCHFKGYLDFGKGMWFTSVDAETWQGIYPKFIHATAAMLNVEQQRRLLILLAKGHAGFSGPLHLLYQQLLNDKDKQLVMHAAQNNTHKGLQKDVRRLALSLLLPESEQ